MSLVFRAQAACRYALWHAGKVTLNDDDIAFLFLQVLLQGEAFSGKTALMAHTAVSSGFPFIRKIAADEMIGMGEVSN